MAADGLVQQSTKLLPKAQHFRSANGKTSTT
jgi:hypothetical protein